MPEMPELPQMPSLVGNMVLVKWLGIAGASVAMFLASWAIIADTQGPVMRYWARYCAFLERKLRLMFICCHPALSSGAQITLTLRLLAGLTGHPLGLALCLAHHLGLAGQPQALLLGVGDHALRHVPDGDARVERAGELPRLLLVPFEPADRETLEELCSELRADARTAVGIARGWRPKPYAYVDPNEDAVAQLVETIGAARTRLGHAIRNAFARAA